MTQVYIERYWRDATPEDAIKEPPMVARFKDKDEGSWHFDVLSGWNRRSLAKWLCDCLSWRFCQVYDAPDPGEGCELIDIDKDIKQDGDEFRRPNGVWKRAASPEFFSSHVYRRRIEQPKPKYVPFTWEDREQLRGRWITRDNQELQLVNLDNSDGFFANGVHVVNLCLYWKFIDTGKPVGKEVVQ